VIIDRQLDGQQQVGHPLHLIDHRPIQALDEALGILAGGGEGGGVVEGEEGAPLRGELPGQGGFAALPGTVQQHHGRIGQGVAQAAGDAAGKDRW